MLPSSSIQLLVKAPSTLSVATRGIARIPHWEHHIRIDQSVGRKRPSQDVLDRFKRLNNGMWIKAHPGRNKLRYTKNGIFEETADYFETCTKEECMMLDKMMTPFWLRRKHYPNDPYEPYHVRHGIDSPRVDYKGRFVRERPKVLVEDSTARNIGIMLGSFIAGAFILIFVVFVFRRIFRKKSSIAFFHPYCDGAGGGERVLFHAIKTLKHEKSVHRNFHVVVYSRVSNSQKKDVLNLVRSRFNISIDENDVEFVHLRTVGWMNPKNFPRFTLILQSIAECLVAFEGLIRFLPEIFIDTTGCPLSMPLFRFLGGCRVACYTHYPTITSQMIKRVEAGTAMYNNANFIANSETLTSAKLLYYRVFALIYKFAGKAADIVMVNGSWTENHIRTLWNCNPIKVFPPVEIKSVNKLVRAKGDPVVILSVGQIRPEKNHKLQIDVLKKSLDANLNICLCIVGGCRNDEDRQRVDELKQYAEQLGVGESISWKLNLPIDELNKLNEESLIGIHTMTEEHFGIAIVESMAAGVIMIAHNSGGPKLDIVEDGVTGYLAATADEYAKYVQKIYKASDEDLIKMRTKARESMDRFSEDAFERNWLAAIEKL